MRLSFMSVCLPFYAPLVRVGIVSTLTKKSMECLCPLLRPQVGGSGKLGPELYFSKLPKPLTYLEPDLAPSSTYPWTWSWIRPSTWSFDVDVDSFFCLLLQAQVGRVSDRVHESKDKILAGDCFYYVREVSCFKTLFSKNRMDKIVSNSSHKIRLYYILL